MVLKNSLALVPVIKIKATEITAMRPTSTAASTIDCAFSVLRLLNGPSSLDCRTSFRK